ncbi:L,D-transpeptidase family protein [Streptomyces carpinensis]|uniref:L,D-transpeptidase family protein n=1 Tax=Streptomyces carpinensis TaxID=66369 RepID=A0ABV1W2S9_9ACTN|nr:L,D-transpeptidase family protein [Streptomyces carpinensis]
MLPEFSALSVRSRRFVVAAAVGGALLVASGCGKEDGGAGAEQVAADVQDDSADASTSASGSPSASASASVSAPASASASAKANGSASPSTSASGAAGSGKAGGGSDSGSDSGTEAAGTAGGSGSSSGSGTGQGSGGSSAPDFPVPVEVGDATQVITVKASGSYATVTTWAKSSAGWQSQFSTSAGRVGSNGVTNGATRRQGTYTTPSGTYTITEGFGVESSGTSMPYHKVGSDDWWVEDPESKYYNSMHGEAGADFPLTEAGDRGSEHLIDYPTQYAKALVVNFNRWPATPGRGAGIFLHVKGSGATAGCVSVPRATMDQIMGWIQPGAHPRIAIG